jgi:hypothetical protein
MLLLPRLTEKCQYLLGLRFETTPEKDINASKRNRRFQTVSLDYPNAEKNDAWSQKASVQGIEV